MKTIGVLGLQGSVIEHMKMLEKLDDVIPLEVHKPEELDKIDALILPGGESTTISKLLDIFGFTSPLIKRIQGGMPVWGTCAGLILLAKNIEGENAHLGLMDITVRRNAYGRQLDSFNTTAAVDEIGEIPLVFIRAPWIENAGENVKVMCVIDGHIVAARQNNMFVTSFHPELTDDISCHEYLKSMIQ